MRGVQAGQLLMQINACRLAITVNRCQSLGSVQLRGTLFCNIQARHHIPEGVCIHLHCAFDKDLVEQFASRDKLHDHEHAVPGGHDLLEVDDVGVVQVLQDVDLPLDLVLHPRCPQPPLVQDLHRVVGGAHTFNAFTGVLVTCLGDGTAANSFGLATTCAMQGKTQSLVGPSVTLNNEVNIAFTSNFIFLRVNTGNTR